MDINGDVIYRTFKLNDESIRDNIVKGSGTGHGISGSVIDSADMSDVDVVQFIEKRSLQDGMDAGDVFLGAMRVRMAGTLYATSRALLFDAYWNLRKALSATLAQREIPGDKGYLPLYFSVPTARTAEYPSGQIDLKIKVLPRSKQLVWIRDNQGGDEASALAIPWQATFVAKDPSITGVLPVDVVFADTVVVTGVTATAATDLVNKTAHGLVAGDRVYFTALTGAAGLVVSTPYYVIASGLTANVFKVSATSGGAAINITTDGTVMSYAKVVTVAGNFTNRGTYHAPLNILLSVGPQAGSITVTAGGVILTITVPVSTVNRVIIYDGKEKDLTITEASVESTRMDLVNYSVQNTYPSIVEGVSAYSVVFIGVVTDPGSSDGSHMWFEESYA